MAVTATIIRPVLMQFYAGEVASSTSSHVPSSLSRDSSADSLHITPPQKANVAYKTSTVTVALSQPMPITTATIQINQQSHVTTHLSDSPFSVPVEPCRVSAVETPSTVADDSPDRRDSVSSTRSSIESSEALMALQRKYEHVLLRLSGSDASSAALAATPDGVTDDKRKDSLPNTSFVYERASTNV